MDDKERFDNLCTGYLTDTLAPEEIPEFLALYHASEENAARFAELEKAYAAASLLHTRKRPAVKARRRWDWRLAGAAAAVAALLCSTAWLGWQVHRSETLSAGRLTELTVPLGSQLKALLPDGSVVWLNSGSRLTYAGDFGRKERGVVLDGEGYFEVVKDGTPFRVLSGDMAVEVLGTRFDLRNYGTDTAACVNLIQGRVAVSSLTTGASATLAPDQMALVDKRSGRMAVRESDAAKAARWTTGKLSFVNTALKDLLQDLERHFDVQIQTEGKAVERERFSGSISLDTPLDDILNYIDVDKKYTWTRDGRVIHIRENQH